MYSDCRLVLTALGDGFERWTGLDWAGLGLVVKEEGGCLGGGFGGCFGGCLVVGWTEKGV